MKTPAVSIGTVNVAPELRDSDDATIDAALELADPMVLRGLLYQLTGDLDLVDIELATVGDGFYKALAPAHERDVEMLRTKCAQLLRVYRDSEAGEIDLGPADRMPVALNLASGMELSDDHMQWSMEELALDPWARSLTWTQNPPTDRLSSFRVAVIGAGMGGLNAGVQLKRAGIPFTVFEKNSDVGGTWYENRYPGVRVDTLSRFYVHLFGAKYDYGYPFCPGEKNRAYLDWVADNFELRDHIVVDTEVHSLLWREDKGQWRIELKGPDGVQVKWFNAVITAVGFLNRPRIPEIEGAEDFEGPSWHTSQWPEEQLVEDKRFAVIGTGCTGYQLVPQLALKAQRVTVFQRRPQWLLPVPGYLAPQPDLLRWLDDALPLFTNFMRFRLSLAVWGYINLAEIDPDYHDPDAVNALNKEQRDASIAFLTEKLGPELAKEMIPPHPVLSARPVVVDTEYSVLDAIQRDNVELVTEGIRRILPTGVETVDGRHHEVDAVVYATGFQASEYLFPMEVVGRNGRNLAGEWAKDGARAYIGMMVPQFPNLWMLYGPNCNGAGLAVPATQEMATYYALRCMEKLLLEDRRAIEPKAKPFNEYNEMLDNRNARMAWSDPRAQNYYWTEHGRSATQNPLHPDEMWRLLHEPNFEELEIR